MQTLYHVEQREPSGFHFIPRVRETIWGRLKMPGSRGVAPEYVPITPSNRVIQLASHFWATPLLRGPAKPPTHSHRQN